MSLTNPTPAAINRIRIAELFGRYSYMIERNENANILILYGDNGTGKTTTLRLLYHLLSVSNRRGHRTALGEVAFRSVEVTLDNDITVFAERESAATSDYVYGTKRKESILAQVNVQFDEDGDIIDSPRTDDELAAVLDSIRDATGVDIYYIGDDRSLQSDRLQLHTVDDPSSHAIQHFQPSLFRRRPSSRSRRPTARSRATDLSVVLAEATEWARRQAIGATSTGTANANSIYSDVIRRIASPQMLGDEKQTSPQGLIEKIAAIETRNRQYEPFGLESSLTGSQLRDALSTASDDTQLLIVSILQPYLESIEARLEAVGALQATISTFVHWANQLLMDKYITLRLPHGIEILTSDGDTLSPEQLSSGEQHLLLLLTSTLYAQERPSLFIIDEPELSLNMKWQRQLVNALTECTHAGSTAFVIATHSFEILAGHTEQVVELIHQDAGSHSIIE